MGLLAKFLNSYRVSHTDLKITSKDPVLVWVSYHKVSDLSEKGNQILLFLRRLRTQDDFSLCL